MKEQEVKKLASDLYRLADLLQEFKNKDLIKKFPILFENSESLFLNECSRIEEWLKNIKGD